MSIVRRPEPLRGYFGIGVYHPKRERNVGGLLRSAHAFGAAFAFTVGRRYERQASDTSDAAGCVPLHHVPTWDTFAAWLPSGCVLIGVELDDGAWPLARFVHPPRACYVLGAEDHGLPPTIRAACHALVRIDGAAFPLNVASAGTVVLADRAAKGVAGRRWGRADAGGRGGAFGTGGAGVHP